jgi:hypothetical protein
MGAENVFPADIRTPDRTASRESNTERDNQQVYNGTIEVSWISTWDLLLDAHWSKRRP